MRKFIVTFYDDRRPSKTPPTEFTVSATCDVDATEQTTVLFHQQHPKENIDDYESHCRHAE
jgi:hypothetical protein